MSDEEYEYEYDSDASDVPMDDANNEDDDEEDDEDQGEFEYTDEEEEQYDGNDINIALENEYYNAKAIKDNDYQEAISKFEHVIQMEADKHQNGDCNTEKKNVQWTFKALKQTMKLRLRYSEYEQARIVYQSLLDCITNTDNEGLSPNVIEKGVNGMLERVSALLLQNSSKSSSGSVSNSPQHLAWFVYDSTLGLFNPTNGSCANERLWFKTNLKYGQLLFENRQTTKLQIVIRDLLQSSNHLTSNSTYMSTSGNSASSTNLMEIYALQIQLYSSLKDHKKLREIYTKAMQVRGGIPHPRTIALIQELGGKMHMSSKEYESANTAFFQAFKSYDEAGDIARLRCLKYLVIASMLHASSINPFDSQEVRPYKDDPEIVAMTNLVDAFHDNDIEKFERILKKNEGRIMDDEFIREYLEDLLRTIRMQVLHEILRPYTRISIEAISKKLNGIQVKDVENLLVTAILDGKLDARIDQVNGVLLKNTDSRGGNSSSIRSKAHSSEVDGNDEGENRTRNSASIGGTGSDGNFDIDDFNNAIPIWGENSVSVRTCSAMEDLVDQLVVLTMAVTAANSRITGNNNSYYSLMKP